MLPEDSNGPLIEALAHAAARQQGIAEGDEQRLVERAKELAATLDPPAQQRLLARLRIEEALAGKDMRREMCEGDAEMASAIAALSDGTRTLIERFAISNPATIVADTRASIDNLTGDETLLTATPDELYERLLGLTFEGACAAVGKTNAKKWIDLVAPAFQQGKGLDLVRAVGCIPHQLYESKKFTDIVHFPHLAALHASLKNAQNEKGGLDKARVLRSRAQLLSYLFTKGIATEAQGTVSVDGNGLWIHLEQRKGADVTNRLDAHLPYEYATEDVLEHLLARQWITENDALECRLRRAEDTGDVLTEHDAERVKVAHYRALSESGRPDKHTLDYLFTKGIERAAKEKTSAIRYPLSELQKEFDADWDVAYKYRNVLELAEDIQRRASGDVRNPGREGYATYDLTRTARDGYERRKKLLHDPLNYDAPRIVGAMLEAYERLGEGKIPFRLFRGTIRAGNTTENTHSFIEIILESGSVQRVLLDADKQLSGTQRKIFESLPHLEKQEHEYVETLAYTYSHYKSVAVNLREMLGPRGFDMDDKDWRPYVSELLQDACAFIMIEAPDLYPQAMASQSGFINKSEGEYVPFHFKDLLDETLERFSKRLFDGDLREVAKDSNARLNRREIRFDEHFLDDFPARFKEKSWTSDAALCEELTGIGQTIVVLDAGDREIEYAMEAKAINALRLLPDRPLVTVIGGCREMPSEGRNVSAIDTMCQNIVEAGDRMTANIVPPGTQSGIGVTMGRLAVRYQQHTSDRHAADKARFFAVSPGGETYYPGNAHMPPESEKEAMGYAIGPFDTIATPFQAGWDWTGERKKNAPYFQHVEYAEAIYNRVSAGQPRITVVGNGGIFTMVEAIAALKNKSAMLLVQDTGRFADLAIALHAERPMLEKLNGDAWEQAVLQLIRETVPSHSTAALLSAYGETNPTPEQRLYREKLREYFLLANDGDVRVTDINAVGTDTELAAAAWRRRRNR